MKRQVAIATFIALTLTLSCITACKKENNSNKGTPTSGSVYGMVVNEGNLPVKGAKVSAGSQTVVTDVYGKFELKNPVANTDVVLIKATAPDYFPGYRNVTKSKDASDYTVIKLINYDGSETPIGNAATGGNASFGTFSISVGNKGFVTESGSAYSGSVTVRARYIQADDPSIDELMPGGDFSALDTSGNPGIMETQGFAAIDFIDNNGNILTPNPGNARVAIQLSPQVASSLSSSSRAWTFNEISGQWNYSGGITVGSSEVTLDFISRFINCDVFASACVITGQVVDCNDKPAKNRKVVFSSDILRYSTFTNTNGYYSIRVSSRPGNYKVSCEDASANVAVYTNGNVTAPGIKTKTSFYSDTYSAFAVTTSFNGGCSLSYSNVLVGASIACAASTSQSSINIKGEWSQKGDSCWTWADAFDVNLPLTNSGGTYSGNITYLGIAFNLSNGKVNADNTFSANVTVNDPDWDAPITKNISLK